MRISLIKKSKCNFKKTIIILINGLSPEEISDCWILEFLKKQYN